MQKLEMFINFNGNCREAVQFYAKVFRSQVGNLMTYGEAPPDPSNPVSDADRNKIMYAGVPIGGMVVMCMDMPSNFPAVIGNNIVPTLNVDDKDEITRIFNQLKEGGKVFMAPQKTFFSEWYCMVEDKFGIVWHVMYYAP